jgi:hypothetical protein
MNKLLAFATAFILGSGLAVSEHSASAQATPEAGVRCDGTLTLLLVTAIDDYDYQPPVALTNFDFGQYAPLVAEAADIPVEQLGTKPTPTPQIGDQAATTLSQAGQNLTDNGLGDVGNAISGLADTASDLANAGQEAVQSGADAVNAGIQGVNNQVEAASSPVLQTGALPGENGLCTTLRTNLLTFMSHQLSADITP